MKFFIAIITIIVLFTACNKENTEASQNQLITCVPVAIDPIKLPASQIDVKTNVIQFVYASITLQKSMSGILTKMNVDIAKNYQFHVYIFTSGRYYLLPSSTTGDNKYNFSIQSDSLSSTVNIVRSSGVTENFTAIKVVAVSYVYLKEQQFAIDYTDFATIQAAFDLP